MNSTNDTDSDDHHFTLDFVLLDVEIWVIVSAIINILANGLLLYCLIKIGLKCSTYVAICNLAILDIIQLISSPSMYEAFSQTNDLLKEFEAHSVFQNTVFCAMYGILLCYILMILKAHLQIIERAFVYIICGLWIILIMTFIAGYLGYQVYYHRGLFFEIYVILFTALFVVELVDQIINTINLGRDKSPDYKICMMLSLLFITIRICFPVALLVMSVITYTFFESKVILHILIGIIQFNSVANIVMLAWIDLKFKNSLYDTLNLKFIVRNNNVNFVNLPEETVNILEE